MFTWINNALAGVALAALAACVTPSGYATTRSASVLDGALKIEVPAGYCIDRSAGRAGPDSAVVLMGRCSDSSSANAALLSVSVGESGSGGVMAAGAPALAAFFTSEQGRATLSRDGKPDEIRIVQALSDKDTFLLDVDDQSIGEYWRAVTEINGRLITVSATGSAGVPLPAEDGRKIIDAMLRALRRANSLNG